LRQLPHLGTPLATAAGTRLRLPQLGQVTISGGRPGPVVSVMLAPLEQGEVGQDAT
jgi:hypothetical protein